MKKIFVIFTLIIVSLCTIVAQDLTQDRINKMSKKKNFNTSHIPRRWLLLKNFHSPCRKNSIFATLNNRFFKLASIKQEIEIQ